MGLRLGTKIKYKIWQPATRRWGKWGAIVVIGVPAVIIIGGGGVSALLLGAGNASACNYSAPAASLAQGLVGYWPMNGNANEYSGAGNNGTVHGATLTTDQQGLSNCAYSFNGTNNYITIPNNSLQEIGTGSMSWNIWFNTTSTTGTGTLYRKSGGSNANGVIMDITNGKVRCDLANGPSVIVQSAASTYNDGKWHLMDCVLDRSANTLSIYMDGQLSASTSSAAHASDNLTSGASIGLGYQYSTNYFSGSMDDLRVYNRALSANEVQELYSPNTATLNIDQGEKGLVGWWRLNGNAEDSTPYGDNGTLSSSPPTLTTDHEGATNSAYSFNGSNNYITIPNNPALAITGDMTISAWVKTINNGSYQPIVSRTGTTGEYEIGSDFRGGSNGTNAIDWRSTSSGAGSNMDLNNFFTGYINTWVHVTAVVTGTTVNFYRNGVYFGQVTGIGSRTATTNPVYIGQRSTNGVFFDGSIGDVRIYNRDLSQAEITNLYNSYNAQINLYTSAGSGGNSVNLSAGLVGYWPFNGNANDATPYSNNGTLSSPPPTLTTNRLGQSTSAYSFNGSSEYISTPSVTAFDPTKDFTISAWVKADSLTGSTAEVIVSQQSGTGNGRSLLDLSSPTNKIASFLGGVSTYGPSVISTGTWYLATIVHSGSVVTVYTNTTSGTPQTVTAEAADGGLVIGSNKNPPSALWSGSISNVRVYNRALSVAEVQALYND